MNQKILQNDNTLRWAAFGLIGLGLLMFFGIGNVILPLIFAVTILLPGLALMAAYHSGHGSTAGLAIPGAILVGTGALLIFQSIFDYWESWAYAWILYGVFIGYGIIKMAERLENANLLEVGRWMTFISGASFVMIGGLVVFLTQPVLQIFLAVLMVFAGLHLLRRGKESRLLRMIPGAREEKPRPTRKIQINVEERVA